MEIVWEPFWDSEEHDSRQFYTLSFSALQMFCEFALIWIQTRWTLHKLRPFFQVTFGRTLSSMEMKDLVLKASRHQDDLDEMEDANLKKNTMTNSVISQTQSEEDNIFSRVIPSVVAGGSVADMVNVMDSIKLNDVLGQSASFDAFALHVAKEISIEMLVSYCEFTQLLQYLFDNFEHMISSDVHTAEVEAILADLPATVPQSYIIRTATNGEGLRKITKKEEGVR